MTNQSQSHYRRVIARAERSDWGNRDAIIAECKWHIEQLDKQAAEFNEKWSRLKQLKKSRAAA